jgi:transcriptional regulator with XRE-family HTH domain
MGRPETALESDGSPERELAIELRGLRQRAGLTYKQLARATSYGTSTLQEAAAGRHLPTLDVTLAIVKACAGDVTAWCAYWAQVHNAISGDSPQETATAVCPPWRSPATADSAGTQDPLGTPELNETPATSRHLPWPRRLSRAWMTSIVSGLVLATGAGITAAALSGSVAGPPVLVQSTRSAQAAKTAERTYPEEEYNKKGAATFQFLNASGPGQPLEFQEIVMVSCKVRNTALPSATPDGYWYRIASMPWDNKYYAVANTFLNGDPQGGPYTHNTDFAVQSC